MAENGYRVEADMLRALAMSILDRAGDFTRVAAEVVAEPLDGSAFGYIPLVSSELFESYQHTLTAAGDGIREYAELTASVAGAVEMVRQSCVAADDNIFDRYRSLNPDARF
ncbi:hypothetical protein O7627_05320 [Solwaraspora sp. WMMD1047]|uniref:hypothetical protein n=1 Tax=Solwaraspora sp. WMMD1047 TaxID=3016102 RepID=UPI0024174226|nr:hypothetical protein [Solwaraspora sp. WMMD1047]MDG4828727.1 hypothetical protein [Solwaraspora sp. WMMD1047]